MQRLYPTAGSARPTTARDAYINTSTSEKPWVIMSMVQSIDGSSSLGGASGGLGSEADQQVFSTLRSRADLLLVGAATARAERYQPLKRPGQRLAIVTASGNFPWEQEVYRHPQTTIVAPLDAPAMPVETLRVGRDRVDLAEALRILKPDVVLLEGGSSLNAQMLSADLVDEICVTTAPITVLGKGARIAAGPMETTGRFRLVHVLEEDGYLFTRYVRLGDADAPGRGR